LVVPALLLVALTATGVGYAIASLLPQQLANLLTQVLVVFVLMFSPLTFPVERLPDWLATIHQFLPVKAMGEVIRGTVASNVFPLSIEPFLVLGAWCLVGFGITYWALSRRR
jgi:ABC-2 type transport system permease protein